MTPKKIGVVLLSLALVACGGGGEAADDIAANEADLAADANLADEAAADEAADMDAFGGNAAALDANSR